MNPDNKTRILENFSLPSSGNSTQTESIVAWLQEAAPYGVLVTDCDLRIQSWNRWFAQHSGKRAGDLAGRHLFTVFPEVEGRKLNRFFEKALGGEPALLSVALHRYLLAFPSTLRTEPEECMLQTVRIAPLRSGKNITGTITLIEDVSEREFHAGKLRREYVRQKILSTAFEKLLLAQRPEEVASEFFPAIAEHLKADAFAIYLSESDGSWRTHTTGGRSEKVRAILAETPPRGWIPEKSRDPGKAREKIESLSPDTVRRLEGRACLVKRLKIGDVLLGAFALVGEKGKHAFAPEDLAIVEAISQYIAVALERTAVEKEIRQAREELEMKVQVRTARLQETVQQLESFSYSIAHDLRAPTRAIKGYGDVLLEDFASELSPPARNFVSRIQTAAVKMELLTKDLLGFCQVSREELTLQPVSIGDMMHELQALLPSLQDSGVLTIEEPLLQVIAHPSMLRQSLANLLENSLKFRSEERPLQIVIRTERREPEIADGQHSARPAFQPSIMTTSESVKSECLSSSTVRIWVEDTGIGIAPRDHQKVFGIFERLHGESEFDGSGIGLAIVAKAIQRMGGACGVQSEKGLGSKFWIDLPEG